MKFREARKRLEALKKELREYHPEDKPLFFRSYGFFKKEIQPEEMFSEGIQTLSIRYFTNLKVENTYLDNTKKRRRQHSTVLKKIVVLTSHVRAATYILLIVILYFVTHMPLIAFSLFDTFASSAHENFAKQPVGNLSHSVHVNVTGLKACLNAALQNEDCFLELENDDVLRQYVKSIFHSVETLNIFYLLAFPITILNAVANPVLYAFWYPDFRKYALQILLWCNKKKEQPSFVT